MKDFNIPKIVINHWLNSVIFDGCVYEDISKLDVWVFFNNKKVIFDLVSATNLNDKGNMTLTITVNYELNLAYYNEINLIDKNNIENTVLIKNKKTEPRNYLT
jgi:hypothetical protein